VKRINPATNNHYKRGDVREDGYRFWGYTQSKIKRNGYFEESWRNPVAFKKHCERCSAWRKNNPERSRQLDIEYYSANKQKFIDRAAKVDKANPEKRLARTRKRQTSQLNRTPKWLTKEHFIEIEEFYIISKMFQLYTGQKYHVDHIIPLQGKNVSGLHVPWNLQVLPAKENMSKGIKHVL
jgi:hypothetical protein